VRGTAAPSTYEYETGGGSEEGRSEGGAVELALAMILRRRFLSS